MLWAAIPAAIAGVAFTFFALPIVLVVRVGRAGEDEPLELRLDAGAWLGLLGLIATRSGTGPWGIGPRLCGRSLGTWYTLGGDEVDTPEARPAPAEQVAPTAPADGESESPGSPEPPGLSLLDRVRRQATLLWPLVGPAWKMLRACPGAFSIRRARASGRVGLSDPAATGQMQGVVYALRAVLPRRIDVDVESDFVHEGARGELAVVVHFRLGKLLFFVVRFSLIAGTRWLSARLSLWRSDRARAAGAA